MATPDILQARLDAAELALDQLLTKGGIVRLEYDGKMVIYKPTDAGALRAYIQELEVQLGQKSHRSRAISVWF